MVVKKCRIKYRIKLLIFEITSWEILNEGPKWINDTLEIWSIDTAENTIMISFTKLPESVNRISINIPNIQSPGTKYTANLNEKDSTFSPYQSEYQMFFGKFVNTDSVKISFETSSAMGTKYHYYGNKE